MEAKLSKINCIIINIQQIAININSSNFFFDNDNILYIRKV
jgi:hypothetical protein